MLPGVFTVVVLSHSRRVVSHVRGRQKPEAAAAATFSVAPLQNLGGENFPALSRTNAG
jgi:hypothetical protein